MSELLSYFLDLLERKLGCNNGDNELVFPLESVE